MIEIGLTNVRLTGVKSTGVRTTGVKSSGIRLVGSRVKNRDAFSEWLDKQLAAKGWSSHRLSQVMGGSAGWLSNVRSGNQSRTRSAVNRIADALNLPDDTRREGMVIAGFLPDDNTEEIPLDILPLIARIRLLDEPHRLHIADIVDSFYRRQLENQLREDYQSPPSPSDDNEDSV